MGTNKFKHGQPIRIEWNLQIQKRRTFVRLIRQCRTILQGASFYSKSKVGKVFMAAQAAMTGGGRINCRALFNRENMALKKKNPAAD
jgi:hypothetical protein